MSIPNGRLPFRHLFNDIYSRNIVTIIGYSINDNVIYTSLFSFYNLTKAYFEHKYCL